MNTIEGRVDIQEVAVSAENAGSALHVSDVSNNNAFGQLRTYTVDHGIVFGEPGVLAVRRGADLVILQESVGHPDKLRLVAGEALACGPSNREDSVSLESACLLDGHWSHNVWHWFMDWLPRVVALELGGFSGTYLIPHGPIYARSLGLLGVAAERVLPRPSGVINVDRLAFTQCINGHQLERWPWLVQTMRDKMIAQLPFRTPPRRLYIGRRGQKRRVVNENELIERLTEYEFSVAYMEDYTIDEQIWLASGADVIIGPHGAGLVFSMFMNEGGLLLSFSMRGILIPA